MRTNKFQKTKICPRCGIKVLDNCEECPECGLVFSRLEIATNRDAKKKKLRHDRDFIINTKKLPKDVSFIKLLLLAIFLGPFGAHSFYVGRYLRGSVMLVDFLCILMLTIFNQQLMAVANGNLMSVFAIVCGFIELLWFVDIFLIATKQFKVPVAIDLNDDVKKDEEINED